MARIELLDIAHTYEPHSATPVFALHPLSLAWEDGGTYALLGPSGCGKSTMLNIMSGLLRASHGRLLIGGRDVTCEPTARRNIAQVFQFPVIYHTKTVYENLAFPLRCRGAAPKVIDARVGEVAELLDLTRLLRRPAHSLTPDAKQLISLGRGLVRNDVAAILMDEPLTVIDPHLKFQLRRKLKEISARYRHTLIYVTHDQNEAMTLADQVVVMDRGSVIQTGTPQELFEQPRHVHVGHFIGSPAMNFLRCQPVAGGLLVGDKVLPMPRHTLSEFGAREFVLGIRPEFVTIEPSAGPQTLPAHIIEQRHMGKFSVVTARVGADLVKAKVPANLRFSPGPAHVGLPVQWRRLYADGRLIEMP